MKKITAALFLLLIAAPAFATRTEIAIPGLPGQARLVYDDSDRDLKIELENTDRFWVTRHGFDGKGVGIYFHEPFSEGDGKGLGVLQSDGTAFDGSTGIENVLYLPNGNKMLCYALGAGQTLAPDMDAGGLDIGGDQAADEGYECITNIGGATGSPLTIGTTAAFHFKVGLTIGDVSGTDDFHCGLRKIEAIEAGVDDYTDVASLAIIAAANPAAINVATALNNAAMSETDTTDTLADATATDWDFLVSAAGVTTFEIDGAAPTTTAAYTFDDGDLVHPFCRFLNDTALADSVTIDDWLVELQ